MTAISHANDSLRTGLPRFQTLNMHKMKNGTAKRSTSSKANSTAGTSGYSRLSGISSLAGLARFSSAMAAAGSGGLNSSAALGSLAGMNSLSAFGSFTGMNSLSALSSLAGMNSLSALSSLAGLYGSAVLGGLTGVNAYSGSNGLTGLNSYAGLAASRTAGTSGGGWSSYSSLPPGDASETTWLGHTIDVEEDVFGETWEQVDELPGYYELKDNSPLTWMGIQPDLEFRFYHAAESTEDEPVLVARGADGQGRVFEQKIHLNRINPYNATRMEMEALTTYYKSENKDISIPFLDYYDHPKMDDRFDYINSLRSAITASRTLGFVRQARQYQDDIDFLLTVTKNQVSPNAAWLNTAKDKRNLELCTSAARERFLSNLSRNCSDGYRSDPDQSPR